MKANLTPHFDGYKSIHAPVIHARIKGDDILELFKIQDNLLYNPKQDTLNQIRALKSFEEIKSFQL